MSEENQITDAELHDENVVEEAHDPKNAEVASVDSVDKAAKATTQAAAPKTKAGMINAMYGKMSKMKKADLQASYGKMMGEEVEGEEADLVEQGRDDGPAERLRGLEAKDEPRRVGLEQQRRHEVAEEPGILWIDLWISCGLPVDKETFGGGGIDLYIGVSYTNFC